MSQIGTKLRETAARWNPVRVGRRAVHRFSRRPRAMQVRTIAVIVAVVAGLVVYVANAPEAQEAPTPFGGLGGGSSAPAPAGRSTTAELAGRPIQLASAISGIPA